jgi:hypothetical protein
VFEQELAGLSGWVPFAALPTVDVPTGPGVYVVVRPSDEPPRFLGVSPAGHFKGRDPTVPVADLEALWVPDTHVVYIGKAELGARGRRGLRRRLDEYRRFGAGLPVGHSGGRRIWQPDDADAARTETEMLAAFRARHGRLPFANMRH